MPRNCLSLAVFTTHLPDSAEDSHDVFTKSEHDRQLGGTDNRCEALDLLMWSETMGQLL